MCASQLCLSYKCFGRFRHKRLACLIIHKHEMKYMKYICILILSIMTPPPKICSHLRVWYLVQKLIRHADNKEKKFARCWKFMVPLLCPNISRSVSRADSLCRKQSHLNILKQDSAFSLFKMADINISVIRKENNSAY